jgi:von Willebrand factor A domain-containing protein 8
MNPVCALEQCYPFPFLPLDKETLALLKIPLKRFELISEETQYELGYLFEGVSNYAGEGAIYTLLDTQVNLKSVIFNANGRSHRVVLHGGPLPSTETTQFVSTSYHKAVLTKLLIAHASSSGDICIIGEKGSGKTLIVKTFANYLGYEVEFLPLYKDMTMRELLQKRTTLPNGDTIWVNSGLVEAALNGRLAVLDQIDILAFGILPSIQRLVSEREMALPDGSFLVHPTRYKMLVETHGFSTEQLKKKGIFPVHPCFRIIAIARPEKSVTQKTTWLSPEVVTMFSFVVFRPINVEEETLVLQTKYPAVNNESLMKLVNVANGLRSHDDEILKVLSHNLSTRELCRICRNLTVFKDASLFDLVMKSCLSQFLPQSTHQSLVAYLNTHGIEAIKQHKEFMNIVTNLTPKSLSIGSIKCDIVECSNPSLVPQISYHENPKQSAILQNLLKDWICREHILLIGNQGVGKNKIVDYFLQRMELPREYIQLHRDTTVYSLTSSPSIVNGLLVYDDSALVRAVQCGYVLVVDEADKVYIILN